MAGNAGHLNRHGFLVLMGCGHLQAGELGRRGQVHVPGTSFGTLQNNTLMGN